MKNKNLRFQLLLLAVFSLAGSQLNGISNLNPLNWFSDEKHSNEVIKLDDDFSKKTENLEKKLAKFKSKDNLKGQQKIYKKIITKYPESDIAKEAAFKRGLYLLEKEKWKDAFYAFSILKKYHPDFHRLSSVIEMQYSCAENLMHNVKKKKFGFLTNSAYNTESIQLFLAFAKLYPFNKNAPLALLNSAKVSKSDKEYDIAIISLKNLINLYPDSSYTAEAYFLIAHIYSDFIKGPEYDLEYTREAIRYCEDFIALYPKHEEIRTIEILYEKMLNSLATNRVLLADYYYFKKRDNVAAIIFYNEAISTAPKSQAAVEAKDRLDAIELGVRPATGRNLMKKLFFIR